MPYISNTCRTAYDDIINEMLDETDNQMFYNAKYKSMLIAYLNSVPPQSQDGQLNYFLTKLFKNLNHLQIKVDCAKLRQFIIEVVKQVYSPSYFNYERIIGLLYCCSREYKRKHGRQAFLVENFVDTLIDKVWNELLVPYEIKKEQENGDIV